MATIWNPSDNVGYTLSNNNLTAQNPTGSDTAYVRATGAARSSGKYYFEITTIVSGNPTIGIASPAGSAAYGQYANVLYYGAGSGYCYGDGGTTYSPGWYDQAGAGTYGFAVDLDAKTIKVRKGTSAWSSAKIITHLASVLPAVGYAPSNEAITLNCGATSFVGTVPDGYFAWDSAAITDDQTVI